MEILLSVIFFIVGMFGNIDAFYISALFAIADAIRNNKK
jgi:hypothetical protein